MLVIFICINVRSPVFHILTSTDNKVKQLQKYSPVYNTCIKSNQLVLVIEVFSIDKLRGLPWRSWSGSCGWFSSALTSDLQYFISLHLLTIKLTAKTKSSLQYLCKIESTGPGHWSFQQKNTRVYPPSRLRQPLDFPFPFWNARTFH